MKVLVVGDGRSAIHEVAVVNALIKVGHEVESFYWRSYFNSLNSVKHLCQRVQYKFIIGPTIEKLNADLIGRVTGFEPDLIFIYRGTHIKCETISMIKRNLPSCAVYGYNNDDPFADGYSPWMWRHFLKGITEYDLLFAYRKHNIAEYFACGANRVELLMPWFIPEKDYPEMEGERAKNKYDVVFVGHFEDDGRIEYLKKVAESEFKFGLYGPDWNRAPKHDWLANYQPICPVHGDSYRRTICSANIAMCFLSGLNRDTYTRRCFEIPAMGVFMLCQYSEDLAALFEDGVDAVFFHNPSDMMEKLDYYTRHDSLREEIAANGLRRVIRDKHDVVSRIERVLSFAEQAKS